MNNYRTTFRYIKIMELNSGENMQRAAHNKQGLGQLFFHILSDIDGFWNDSEIELKHFH